MKIAASDFDGTLYFTEKTVSEENLAAIGQWRAAGNKFGIVTGRSYAILMRDANRCKVPFDFLICDNGATVFDDALRSIHSACIPDEIIESLLLHPCLDQSWHRVLSTPQKTYAFALQSESWIQREKYPIEIIEAEKVLSVRNITQVTLSFATTPEAEACAATINRLFGGALYAHQNKADIDVTLPEVSKSAGIKNLQKLQSWQEATVFVIGDEKNDLSMLRDFRGFTVATARDEIKRAASKIYGSVAEMLRERM